MTTDESHFLHELEAEVQTELRMAGSSHPEEALALPQDEWLFDPTDVEREEIGLRSLLSAVEALDSDVQSDEFDRTPGSEGAQT